MVTERQEDRVQFADVETRPYRIGWWTHPWWPRKVILRCFVTGRQPDGKRVRRRGYLADMARNLKLVRRPHRPWQSEAPSLWLFARRAFTAEGARRKMVRDYDYAVLHGRPSPYQRWRRRWADRRAA